MYLFFSFLLKSACNNSCNDCNHLKQNKNRPNPVLRCVCVSFKEERHLFSLFSAHPVFSARPGLPLGRAGPLPVLTKPVTSSVIFPPESSCALRIQERKPLRCLIHLCLSFFTEIPVFLLGNLRVSPASCLLTSGIKRGRNPKEWRRLRDETCIYPTSTSVV